MPGAARVWTREEVLALPDDGERYELIDGELLVSPSPMPPHQRVVGQLFYRLAQFLREQIVGEAMMSPADLDLESGQLSQPDVFVAPRDASSRRPTSWAEIGIPLLVAEVLSPSTARYDRITKRLRYQRSGVAEYWILDMDARTIERWTPGDTRPEVLDERLTWHPAGASAALVIDIVELFRDALGPGEAPSAGER